MELKFLKDLTPEQIEKYTDLAVEYGLNLLSALAVFFVGKWISKFLINLLKGGLKRSGADETIISFVGNIAYSILLVLVIIQALGTLGVDTTSFAAAIAAAGLAIGLAMKDSLSNFASGVMIIIFKWFKKGDFVEVAGVSGSVEEVKIFTTRVKTGDNKSIIIPNSKITTDVVVNYTKQKTRRVDMIFGIGYDDDIKLTKKTLEKILSKDKRVLKDPAPKIAVHELADSSVNFICRPWVKTTDYWDVYWDTHESVKLEFDKAGISIPYPQRDVHMHNVPSKKPVAKNKK